MWSSLIPVVVVGGAHAPSGRGVGAGPSVSATTGGVLGAAVLAPLHWGGKPCCRRASAGTGMVERVDDSDTAPQPSFAGVAACADRLAAVAACVEDVDDSLAGCGCGALIS